MKCYRVVYSVGVAKSTGLARRRRSHRRFLGANCGLGSALGLILLSAMFRPPLLLRRPNLTLRRGGHRPFLFPRPTRTGGASLFEGRDFLVDGLELAKEFFPRALQLGGFVETLFGGNHASDLFERQSFEQSDGHHVCLPGIWTMKAGLYEAKTGLSKESTTDLRFAPVARSVAAPPAPGSRRGTAGPTCRRRLGM